MKFISKSLFAWQTEKRSSQTDQHTQISRITESQIITQQIQKDSNFKQSQPDITQLYITFQSKCYSHVVNLLFQYQIK